MKLLLKLLVLSLFSLSIFVPVTHAKEKTDPVNVTLEKSKIITDDYFAAGDSVRLSGTINGDAYIAGGMVIVDGIVNGDLLVAGGTVRIEGPVKNDIRVLGGTVTFTNTVGGNVTVGAGTVVISPQAKINGSMVGGAGTLDLYGSVGKGLTAAAGALTTNAAIGGNVMVATEEFTMQPKTKIGGDLTYWSQKQAVIADNVALSGDTVFHKINNTEAKASRVAKTTAKGVVGALYAAGAVLVILGFVAMYIAGLIIVWLLPSFSEKTISGMEKNLWGSFGLGIVTMMVLPSIAVTSMLTVIGIPLGVFLLMLTALVSFIGHIYAALFVGKSLFNRFNGTDVHTAWQLLAGMIVLGIVSLIPILGWLAKGILVLIGTGAILFEKQRVYRQMRSKHLL